MPILWVFKTDVFVVQTGLCAIKIVENRFFTIYFYDPWHGNTGGLKGLPGVTGGYKGLRGLQRVTGSYRGLQGVTRGDMG